MAESFTQVPPNSTGNKLRDVQQTIGANTVHMPVVVPTWGAHPPRRYKFATRVLGVAGAQVFVALSNPSGGTKFHLVRRVTVERYGVAAALLKQGLEWIRSTAAASAGTLQAATAIFKDDTNDVNTTAEVRTANPTITAGAVMASLGNHVLVTAVGMGTGPPSVFDAPEPGPPLCILRANEGLAIRNAAGGTGDVDETYGIAIEWDETDALP